MYVCAGTLPTGEVVPGKWEKSTGWAWTYCDIPLNGLEVNAKSFSVLNASTAFFWSSVPIVGGVPVSAGTYRNAPAVVCRAWQPSARSGPHSGMFNASAGACMISYGGVVYVLPSYDLLYVLLPGSGGDGSDAVQAALPSFSPTTTATGTPSPSPSPPTPGVAQWWRTPAGSLMSDNDGSSTLTVCRAQLPSGDVVSGKALSGNVPADCNVPWGGSEYLDVVNFTYLRSNPNLVWDSVLQPGAALVVAGSVAGVPVSVCRTSIPASYNPSPATRHPGYTDYPQVYGWPAVPLCVVAWGGMVWRLPNFEFAQMLSSPGAAANFTASGTRTPSGTASPAATGTASATQLSSSATATAAPTAQPLPTGSNLSFALGSLAGATWNAPASGCAATVLISGGAGGSGGVADASPGGGGASFAVSFMLPAGSTLVAWSAGGGALGGGGGGASALTLRRGGASTLVAVAGGGGGGDNAAGGNAGPPGGVASAGGTGTGSFPGQGATQTGPGAAGISTETGFTQATGGLGSAGGAGGAVSTANLVAAGGSGWAPGGSTFVQFDYSGGGGGGGYFGGGGGAFGNVKYPSGGGGGSSWVNLTMPAIVSSATTYVGAAAGKAGLAGAAVLTSCVPGGALPSPVPVATSTPAPVATASPAPVTTASPSRPPVFVITASPTSAPQTPAPLSASATPTESAGWVPGGANSASASPGAVLALAALPGGTGVACAREDGVVRLWRAAPGPDAGLKHSLEGHSKRVYCLAVRPGGHSEMVLASGSRDRTVRLWRALPSWL